MDDPATKSVKLIPCHTLTAAIKDIFHIMTEDREELVLKTMFLSINYTAFPTSISTDINQTQVAHMCLRDMFALPLSYRECLSTLKHEKEAL